MMSYTPYYIILGEFGNAILLALLAKPLSRGNWTTTLWAGIAGGVGIFICYAITDGIYPR
jgi:hypothetical protein